MLKSRILIAPAIMIFAFTAFSCSSIIYKTVYPALNDGKYDSEFPYKNSSEQLDNIGNTIQRISSLAFYKAYVFPDGSYHTLKDINDDLLDDNLTKVTYLDRSSSGTATVIFAEGSTIGLLSCAHVVDFQDTIVTYFADSKGEYSNYVQSIAFKTKQFIFGAGFPENSELNILAIDRDADLVFLGRKFASQYTNKYPAFAYPFGRAKELEWGSFVYLFGYPLNYKMISQAIVSSPNMDRSGDFLVNAVVNRGYSGGIVLAVRDGVPNFELVGIIQWIPEEPETILKPAPLKENLKYNPLVPYKGEMYVKEYKVLKYGITKIISAESILDFMKRNKEKLKMEGFYLKQIQ